MNKQEFAALCGQFCRQKQAEDPPPKTPFVVGGAALGGLGGAGLGAGAGGLIGLIREAFRKRKDGAQSDYIGAMIRNGLGGAAIGGLGGAAYGGVVGSRAPVAIEEARRAIEEQNRQIRLLQQQQAFDQNTSENVLGW